MTESRSLSCACGAVRIDVVGASIVSSECCCDSCRKASERIEALPGAPNVLEPHGAVRYELYRKDRVTFVSGQAQMREFRVSPESPTRRVVAACCSTPLFMEFQNGHWLSMFGVLWPTGTLPALQLRTMASDLSDPTALPADVPNLKTHNGAFMFKLLRAWASMGFRAPKITVAGELHA